MKSVSIQHLKRTLSAYLAAAAAGETILVTKHRRPLAVISPAVSERVSRGEDVGKRSLRRLFDNATGGDALRILLEDRHGDESAPGHEVG